MEMHVHAKTVCGTYRKAEIVFTPVHKVVLWKFLFLNWSQTVFKFFQNNRSDFVSAMVFIKTTRNID